MEITAALVGNEIIAFVGDVLHHAAAVTALEVLALCALRILCQQIADHGIYHVIAKALSRGVGQSDLQYIGEFLLERGVVKPHARHTVSVRSDMQTEPHTFAVRTFIPFHAGRNFAGIRYLIVRPALLAVEIAVKVDVDRHTVLEVIVYILAVNFPDLILGKRVLLGILLPFTQLLRRVELESVNAVICKVIGCSAQAVPVLPVYAHGYGDRHAVLLQQPERWAIRRAKIQSRKEKRPVPAIVNEYEWNRSDDLAIMEFSGASMEWLDMVVQCRSNPTYRHSYDIVTGKIANDNVGETVSFVIQGIMRKEDAIERLKFEKINNQIAFCTEKALSQIHFITSYTVEG